MRILAAALGVLLAVPAFAQSPGTVNLPTRAIGTTAPTVTTAAQVNTAVNNALAAKADATNGVLTTPTVNGGALTGIVIDISSITNGTISGTPISGSTGAFTTVNGATLSGGTLAGYNGNLFIGSEQNAANFTGTESTFIGDRAGGSIVGGNFNLAIGHNACGIGAGGSLTVTSMTCLGTDAGRNLGASAFGAILMGSGSGENFNGNLSFLAGVTGNNYTTGIQNLLLLGGATIATGSGNVILGQYADATASTVHDSVIIGSNASGGQAGARGGPQAVVVGAKAGNGSLSGFNYTLIGYNIASTTCANINNIVLIGSSNSVDCPSASAGNWANFDNVILASTVPATIASGFGTGAAVVVGATSGTFTLNVGTGGAASSGVVNVGHVSTNAPNGWACDVTDITNPASFFEIAIPTGTQTVTVTNYSRSTNTAIAWTASDVLLFKCNGY